MSQNLKKMYINIVTLTFDLEIQGQTWSNAFNMISLVVYILQKLVFGVYIVLNWCRKIPKKYINILTFNLEMQGQTWHNELNMLSLGIYWETCVWCLQSPNRSHGIGSFRYILPEIPYWMRYVMFDLAFQGLKSRSRYWYIFFWIPRHRFSTYWH